MYKLFNSVLCLCLGAALLFSVVEATTHEEEEEEEEAKESTLVKDKSEKGKKVALLVGGTLGVAALAIAVKKRYQQKEENLKNELDRQRLLKLNKEKEQKRLEQQEQKKREEEEKERKRKEQQEKERREQQEKERKRKEQQEKERLEEDKWKRLLASELRLKKKREEQLRKIKKERALKSKKSVYSTPTYPKLTSKNSPPKEGASKEVLAFEQLLEDFYTTESLKLWKNLLHDIFASYIPSSKKQIIDFSKFADRSMYSRSCAPRDNEKTKYVLKHGIGRIVCHHNLRRVINNVLDAYQSSEDYKMYTREQLDCQKPVRKWLLLASEDKDYKTDKRIRNEEGLENIFSVEETKEIFLQNVQLRLDLFWAANSFFSFKFKKRTEDIAQMKKELEKLVTKKSRLDKGLIGKVRKFIGKEKRATKKKALDLLLKVKIALLPRPSEEKELYCAAVVGEYIKPSLRRKVDLKAENARVFVTISKYARLDTSPIANNFFMVQEKLGNEKLKDRPSLIWFDTEFGAGWPS